MVGMEVGYGVIPLESSTGAAFGGGGRSKYAC